MSGDRGPSVIRLAERALRDAAHIHRGDTVVAAVSGGPDSMAMLDILVRCASTLGFCVHAHGVDHGLRTAAAAELDLAEAFAVQLGVPFSRTCLHIAQAGNLQARARTARYEALERTAIRLGARVIATAHHADDQAETVLMRLLRGAGPRGLAGLRVDSPLRGDSDVRVVRPLLHARRAALLAHNHRFRIPSVQDPSNANPRFLRVRVRTELLPLLEQLSPRVVDHLCALAEQFGNMHSTLDTSFPLPRPTQVALSKLAATRSRTTRVWLPGGLFAAIDDSETPSRRRRSAHSAAPPEKTTAVAQIRDDGVSHVPSDG